MISAKPALNALVPEDSNHLATEACGATSRKSLVNQFLQRFSLWVYRPVQCPKRGDTLAACFSSAEGEVAGQVIAQGLATLPSSRFFNQCHKDKRLDELAFEGDTFYREHRRHCLRYVSLQCFRPCA